MSGITGRCSCQANLPMARQVPAAISRMRPLVFEIQLLDIIAIGADGACHSDGLARRQYHTCAGEQRALLRHRAQSEGAASQARLGVPAAATQHAGVIERGARRQCASLGA